MIHMIIFIFICFCMGYVCKKYPVEAYKAARIIKWLLIGLAAFFLLTGALLEYRQTQFEKFQQKQKSADEEFIKSSED